MRSATQSQKAASWRPHSVNWFWSSAVGARIAKALFRLRGPEAGEVELVQRRIFIVPSRAGLMLGLVLIALLLGSINYTLGLGYVLTFLVVGIAWIGMFHTFRNLAHLHLRGARVDPVFAGEIAEYRIVLVHSRGATAPQAFGGLGEPGSAERGPDQRAGNRASTRLAADAADDARNRFSAGTVARVELLAA